MRSESQSRPIKSKNQRCTTAPRSRIDLPRVEFKATAARILADDLPLTVQNVAICEGEPNLRILLRPDWQSCRSYCVEVTIDTETPSFTPLEKGM